MALPNGPIIKISRDQKANLSLLIRIKNDIFILIKRDKTPVRRDIAIPERKAITTPTIYLFQPDLEYGIDKSFKCMTILGDSRCGMGITGNNALT
jgi:hypothetical protein